MSRVSVPYPPVEEIIHGVTVKDPYRWLEDRSLPETEEWLRDQKRRCDEYFAECPDLDRIRERVREYLDVEVMDEPARIGETLFFRRRAKGQEQGCIYVRENGVDRCLVDPSSEGIFVSVGIHRISRDGRLLAYERKVGGEDTKEIHIVNVETGQRLSTHLERGFARGFVFTLDNRGFYYCHETPTATRDHEIRLRLFDESVEDQVVFRAARSQGSRLVLTADEAHLGVIYLKGSQATPVEDLWTASLADPTDWRCIAADKTLPFIPLLQRGRVFAVTSDDKGQKTISALNPFGEALADITQGINGALLDVVVGKNHIHALVYEAPAFTLHTWALDASQSHRTQFPDHNTITLLHNSGDGQSLFLTVESSTDEPYICEYHSDTGCLSIFHKRPTDTSLSGVRTRDIGFAAQEGTLVSCTLIESDNGPMPKPLIVTTYGGFGAPTTPRFSVLFAILLELGAQVALAHISGRESDSAISYGTKNLFNNTSIRAFIAVVESLCKHGFTTPDKLACVGGSHSGLVVGTAMTQRPGLFRAVLCVAPLLDMVRYEIYNDAWKWRGEYGSVGNAENFASLYSYSPYHAVRDHANYPAMFLVSGDRDSRCNPIHAHKMAALLQNHSAERTVLLDHSKERGHSPTLPYSQRVDALARRIAFLCRELQISSDVGGPHA